MCRRMGSLFKGNLIDIFFLEDVGTFMYVNMLAPLRVHGLLRIHLNY